VQHIQIPGKNNQKHTWKEKLKWKSSTLLKEKNEMSKIYQKRHCYHKKVREKLQNTGHTNQEINRNSTPQISTEKQRFNLKKCQC
jgi:hypothetical protein